MTGAEPAYEDLSHAVPGAGMSERLEALKRWLTGHWPGRIALGSLAEFGRMDLFDRAMAIAAQLFTSVFPLLIMMSVWVGQSTSERLAEAVSMPPVSQEVLDQALDESGVTAFGLVGTVIVLASATSLSRALARAMAGIWRLPRPKSRLNSAWRWLAVLLALALSALAARAFGRFTDAIPPRPVWTGAVTIGVDVLVAAFVPWLLLAGQVRVRRLLPGAFVYAIAMLVVRPVTAEHMPAALEQSAQRYGSIGVAFTYVAWLYVWSFAFLAAAIIGRVVTEDPAALGLFIRGGDPASAESATSPSQTTDGHEEAGPAG